MYNKSKWVVNMNEKRPKVYNQVNIEKKKSYRVDYATYSSYTFITISNNKDVKQ